MKKYSNHRLCDNRDEIVNHVVSKCSKLAQKENKSRYDRVGKLIHGELCNRLEFNHANKWYIHKPESI